MCANDCPNGVRYYIVDIGHRWTRVPQQNQINLYLPLNREPTSTDAFIVPRFHFVAEPPVTFPFL